MERQKANSSKASDPLGVMTVKARSKPMPSTADWVETPMRQEGGRWVAEVPLTAEGIQYNFEVIDAAGNGVVVPDVRRETPYVTVEGWAEAPSSQAANAAPDKPEKPKKKGVSPGARGASGLPRQINP